MPDEGAEQPQRNGRIATFYSFKGGTGRTMAVANVAWILAANGNRVLVGDWDLESPGLHLFFQPFMDSGTSTQPGIIDFIRRYEWAAIEKGVQIDAGALTDDEVAERFEAAIPALITDHVDQVDRYTLPVSWQHFPQDGAIDFLGAGKQSNGVYERTLSALDWDNLYDHLGGGALFDSLREKLKVKYDYILLDSRAGLSDIPDICTLHLPDIVIDCFTLSNQGVEGAATIARLIQRSTDRDIAIYPVPMRIDPAQRSSVDAGLQLAADLFDGLPTGMTQHDRGRYWDKIGVPYCPAYAYEEMLATFGDQPGSENSLLTAYQRIAGLITGNAAISLPPLEEWLRRRTRLQFTRRSQRSVPEVIIQFSPQDQLWAEWIVAVLAGAGIYARLATEFSGAAPASATGARVIAVASEAYLAAKELLDSTPDILPELLVWVTDVPLSPGGPRETPVIFLANLPEDQAARALIERIGGRQPLEIQSAAEALRYPGGGRQVSNIPARNVNFFGRDAVLLRIREQLRSFPSDAFHPLTIQGIRGAGKTQVALEYAQRFGADYDVTWWIDCVHPQYVGSSLAELGTQLQGTFNASVAGDGAGAAEEVLDYLSKRSGLRWLLVYDNAEHAVFDDIEQVLPQGGGHVLITSRADLLAGRGTTMRLSGF